MRYTFITNHHKIKILMVLCCLMEAQVGRAQCEIDSLIERGQYLSAYQCADGIENPNVEQALKKIDIALNYYFHSQYHRSFSFVNLRADESLFELRENEPYGKTPFAFNVDSTLLALHEHYPDDYEVVKKLGDFYNQIYNDFGDAWGERSEVLLDKSNTYYQMAYEQGVYDYKSLYGLGYYQSLFENYFAAQNWFLMSLKERPDDALTNYSLSVTYLFDGLYRSGIQYAAKAYELYTDSLKKSDAARITGILLLKDEQFDNAFSFFEKADALHSNYRPNQMYLLKTALLQGKEPLVIDLGCQVLGSSLYQPELPEEFNSMFMHEDKVDVLCLIYDELLIKHSSDFEACGNIRFHYGKLLYLTGEERKAKKMIKKSRKDFEVVFNPTHQVFEAIDQTLQRL